MLHAIGLPVLGQRIAAVDRMILELVKQRQVLSHHVGLIKRAKIPPDKIYNKDRELSRIASCRDIAEELGLDADFAQGLLYSIIGESCKLQMMELQNGGEVPCDVSDEEWRKKLKENLLVLTERVADKYDAQYHNGFSALGLYRDYEAAVLSEVIRTLPVHGVALDLGCATGVKTFELAQSFELAVGYDISPSMLGVACAKASNLGVENIEFSLLDLESGGLQLENESVSFVLMNLGTASDVPNIEQVIAEVQRVLVPGGKFLFSFYNSNALMYKWSFLPWGGSLAAEMNHEIKCLDVRIGKEVFPVYAHAYSTEEVHQLFSAGFKIEKMLTFPTVSPVLPDSLLKDENARETLQSIDIGLAVTRDMGAYIIAVGEKQ